MNSHLLMIICLIVVLGAVGVACLYQAFEQRDQILRALAALASILIFLGTIILISREIGRYYYVKQFAAPEVMSEYLASYPSVGTTKPYLPGETVIIDRQKKSLSRLVFHLPKGLRAGSPQEVRAIVLISCERETAGTSPRGEEAALRQSCDVEVVDRTVHAIVARNRFVFPNPKKNSGEQDIFEYIVGLPQGNFADYALPPLKSAE